MKNFIHKLFVFLHLKEDYGFTRLMYRGIPIVEREDMPTNKIGFINEETARVRILNWKTGKFGKLMTFRQFYAWIARENKKKKGKI